MSTKAKRKTTMRVTISIPVFVQRVLDIVNQQLLRGSSVPKVLKASKRFQELSDGWVRDLELKIDWAPSYENKMNFAQAVDYCGAHAGRLPSIKELLSIIDYEKSEPAVNTDFFGGTKHDDYYWSGTKVAGGQHCAWCVSFRFGNVFDGNMDYSNYVRPVRASQ